MNFFWHSLLQVLFSWHACPVGAVNRVRRGFLSNDVEDSPFPPDRRFYHTSGAIHQRLLELASGACRNAKLSVRTVGDGNAESHDGIDIVDVVSESDPESGPKNRFFLLFGEHARELISAESSLHFLETLCGETRQHEGSEQQFSKAQKTLQNTSFRVIVNGNPVSRRKVEGGEYCLRVNENGVDLNRNWDEKWEAADGVSPNPDTFPGPAPFSERETRIFRDAVRAFEPTAFLTVHSGTKGMYMPWAYDREHKATNTKNGQAMLQMLRSLDEEYCKCPFGAAGQEVGYSCPGTCLDYVFEELDVKYSFAFEIYTQKEDWPELENRFQEKISQASDFFQMRESSSRWEDDAESCFSRFNPVSQAEFEETLSTWTSVYLDLADQIAADLS